MPFVFHDSGTGRKHRNNGRLSVRKAIIFESSLLFVAVAGCVFGFLGWWFEAALASVLAVMCVVVIVLQRRDKE